MGPAPRCQPMLVASVPPAVAALQPKQMVWRSRPEQPWVALAPGPAPRWQLMLVASEPPVVMAPWPRQVQPRQVPRRGRPPWVAMEPGAAPRCKTMLAASVPPAVAAPRPKQVPRQSRPEQPRVAQAPAWGPVPAPIAPPMSLSMAATAMLLPSLPLPPALLALLAQ